MRDTADLLRLIKRAEKRKLYANAEKTIRMAVLGSYSIQYIVKALRYLIFENYHIYADIFEGDYDGIAKALLNKESEYYQFHPEVTVILPDATLIDVAFFQNVWKSIPGYVLQSNFIVPSLSSLGNLEMSTPSSRNFQIAAANLELARQKPGNVTLLDFEGLAARVGKDHWYDYPAYFSTKQGFCLDYLGEVCWLITRQFGALYGKIKKCLVLDLDNTLWGGIVGEDGYAGIVLDPNDPIGEAYRYFQKYVLSLKDRGVLLAVCSKNEMEIAQEPFLKNPNMVLKLSDISCFIANWEDKAQNIQRIANTLNIGTDSLVFFDDNPAEREIVRMNLPEVTVLDVPDDPAYYAKALSDTGVFDWIQITAEDLNRANTYLTNRERTRILNESSDYEAYLAALEMEFNIGFMDETRIPRFTQLINKTNQFNLRTQRYTEEQIREMLANPAYKLIYAELSDKFDHYGLISCVILKDNFIDTWVMSCRVFKRRVENKIFQFILDNTSGPLYGEFLPTAKNMMVKEFYPQIGFKKNNREGEYIYERI